MRGRGARCLLVLVLGAFLALPSRADDEVARTPQQRIEAWLSASLRTQGAHEQNLRTQGVPMIHALHEAAEDANGSRRRRIVRLARTMLEDWHRARTPAGMVYIPCGWVDLDPVPGRQDPRAWVEAFYIDRTEVTHVAFRTWWDGARPRGTRIRGKLLRGDLTPQNAELPIAEVSWDEANRFAREQRGARLPTLQEWQRAARGSSRRPWPWGTQDLRGRANVRGYGPGRTMRVGSYPRGASPFGVLDMLGNVAEWTSSRSQMGRARNNLVPSIIGGSFRDRPERRLVWYASTRRRRVESERTRLATLGFRCAQNAPELPKPPGEVPREDE